MRSSTSCCTAASSERPFTWRCATRTGQRWSCRTWPSGPAGEPDDLEWLQGWCATLREHVKAGRCVRRARVVSEPLSDYQRWSYSIANPMVEAGEDIRWVPRRLVSSVALPGNDFYLFDDRLALFLLYSGNGLSVGMLSSSDPADLRLCRSAFEAVWKLSIPHREYAPV